MSKVSIDDPRVVELLEIFKPSNLSVEDLNTTSLTTFLGGALAGGFQAVGSAVMDGLGVGGFSNYANLFILSTILSSIENNGEFEDFYQDAINYSKTSNNAKRNLNNTWFGKNISNDDLEQLAKIDYATFLSFGTRSVIKTWTLENGRLTKKEFGPLSEDQKNHFKKIVVETIDDALIQVTSGNPLIQYLVNNYFTIDKYNDRISRLVSERIRNESFDFQIPAKLYLDTIAVTTDQSEGEFKQTIPESSKVNKNLTEEVKKLMIKGVAPREYLEQNKGIGVDLGGFVAGSKVSWPGAITKNELNPNQPVIGAIETLEDFSSLEGTKIYSYPFKYYKEYSKDWAAENLQNWWLTLVPVFGTFLVGYGFIFGEVTSTKEFIERAIKAQFALILVDLLEDLSNGQLDQTVGEYFESTSVDGADGEKKIVEAITNIILTDKEIVRRIQVWNEIADASDDGELTDEEENAALSRSLDAWASGRPTESTTLTDEEIENRRKFFKQCALLMNMPSLRKEYDSVLKDREGDLYNNRFYMVYNQQGGQEKLLSNLLTSANEQKLMEIPSHTLSSLVPKIRLFKVKQDGDKITNTEFVFDATSQIDRKEDIFKKPTTFLNESFDKGAGCGLKEFSFEFNGTNPAESRNDIKATLKLYFQTFNDFIVDRKSKDGSYRYVDLIIQPTPDTNNMVNGIEVVSPKQYEPSFYRIRADVGYRTDGIEDEDLRKAILVSNKSFFLNMVDHDIQFKNDGSVEVSISYRAYVESLLKHPRLDALASPELIAKRIENAKILAKELSRRRCTKEKIQELQVTIAGIEEIITKRSLSSIVDRLRDRKKIYQVQVNESDRKQFMSDGYFKKCRLKKGIRPDEGSNNLDVGVVLNNELPENSEDFNFLNSTNGVVQFFFFGDLLHTILDCVYKDGSDTPRQGSGFQNSKILLGAFEFDPFQSEENEDKVFNIAQMPISVDFFSRWFVDEVMSQKSTRKTFPVMNFIRSLTNHLMKPSLLEICINRNVEKTLRFQTCQITTYSDDAKERDTLKAYNTKGSKRIGMEVMDLRSKAVIPLRGGGDNDENPNNFFNYIVVSSAGSTLSYSGDGVYGNDIAEGRLHVNIGQNSGLVKSISLSKSDQQYIREARFFQQGIDGLLQLSAVYVATLEMFGNTLFYPGMEFFFNPYGLGGGTNFGSPTEKDSVANKLGIGGYHTITSVRSVITPGSFKTTVAGQQYFSGATEDREAHLRGGASRNNRDQSIESYVQEDFSTDGSEGCTSTILGVQRFNPDASSEEEDSGIDREESDFRAENESEQPVETRNIPTISPDGAGEFEVGGEMIPGEFYVGGEYYDEIWFEYVDDNGEFAHINTGVEYQEQ